MDACETVCFRLPFGKVSLLIAAARTKIYVSVSPSTYSSSTALHSFFSVVVVDLSHLLHVEQ